MTISVGPERSTLSLPGSRLRSDEPTLRAGPNGVSDRSAHARPEPSVNVSRSAVADLGALRAQASGLDQASSVTDAALGAADAVLNLLVQLRDGGPGERPARMVLDRIDEAVRGAGFAGANLLDGSLPAGLRLPASADGSGEVVVRGADFRAGGPLIAIDPEADAATATAQAESSLAKAGAAREALREDSRRLEAHRSFTSLLSEAVAGGDASLDVEGARLAALSIRQALAGGSSALFNGAPQAVLSLFR